MIVRPTVATKLARTLARAILSLIKGVLMPLLILSIPLIIDRGYTLWLLIATHALVAYAAYRYGVREGEFRERFRHLQQEYEELRRRLLSAPSW